MKYRTPLLLALGLAAGPAMAQGITLPEVTGPVPVTADSHIFNGAAWQVEPIILEDYGFVEEEFFISGAANVYDWVPGGDFTPDILRSGDYTTRITVRRPADMSEFSGRVVVEMINPTAYYDWTAMWAALWERVVANGDVYVGISSKPAVFGALQAFDPDRYAPLSMANPLPADQQLCGTLPGDEDFDPNLSREYENGLIWDALSQLSALLRSDGAENPLGAPARLVFLTGESQTGNYAFTYYRYIHPAASAALGAPVFDGYLTEAAVHSTGSPIHQCAEPLPEGDAQLDLPGRGVPLMMINSQWDFFPARGTPRKPDSATAEDMSVQWELAGSHHGWKWQYMYGDARQEDLGRAGMLEWGEWQPWTCEPGRIEVPLYMAEKAMYEAMIDWVEQGIVPPSAPLIDTGADGAVAYDANGTATGGLRFPMIAVPVASYGEGQALLSEGCPEIEPFPAERLAELYGDRESYLQRYSAATWELVRAGFLLPEDVPALLAEAAAVPF